MGLYKDIPRHQRVMKAWKAFLGVAEAEWKMINLMHEK